jgi:hypothetical protein
MAAENRSEESSEEPPQGAGLRAEHVFLVGLDRLPAQLHSPGAQIRQVGISALNSALLYVLRPDHVVCPLVSLDFDAVQLATRLRVIGYGGRLTVVADVPDPSMIARELAEVAPGIRIAVIRP